MKKSLGDRKELWIAANESGAFLLIIAILVVALLALVALAIDTAINMTGQAQYERTATDAALAAAERFSVSTAPNVIDRVDDAVEEAQRVVNLNISGVSLAHQFIGDPSHTIAGGTALGEEGVLEHGIWYFTDPGLDAANCEVNGGTVPSPFRPCFRSLTAVTAGDPLMDRLNAFRLRLALSDNKLVRPIFGGGLPNNNGQRLAARATAAIVPRYIVFLPDVTGSVILNSHKTINPTVVNPAYQSFPATNNTCTTFYPQFNGSWGIMNSMTPSQANRATATNGQNSYDFFFQSDYTCVSLAAKQLPANTDFTYNFKIDTMFLGSTYRRAEPLDTILDSINASLTELQNRGTAADRAGIIAFDSDNNNTARVTAKANGQLTMISPKSPTGSDDDLMYKRLLKATNTVTYPNVITRSKGAATGSAAEQKDFMLFPKGVVDGSSTEVVNTDIFRALENAGTMLNNSAPGADLAAVRAEMIIYSDGASNCYLNRDTSNVPIGRQCNKCSTDHGCGSFAAEPVAQLKRLNYSTKRGVDEVLTLFDDPTDNFIKNRVALNVFLFGDVGPHEVVYYIGGGHGCLTQSEILSARDEFGNAIPLTRPGSGNYGDGTTFVDLDNNTSTPPSNLYPNVLANAAANSGGFWIPIRPPCSTNNVIDFNPAIQSACGLPSVTLDGNNNPKIQPLNLPQEIGCNNGSRTGANAEICKYVDNKGRLFCDLRNRSFQQQIQDGIKLITSQNPYVPVDVR